MNTEPSAPPGVSGRQVEYVALSAAEPLSPAAAFWFERFVQAAFPVPADDPPHRHNYHEIILIQAGSGRHRIDGQPAELAPNAIALIAKGQVHWMEYAAGIDGFLLRFTDDFLPADLVSQTWDYHAVLFNHLGVNQTLALAPGDMADLVQSCELLERENALADGFQHYTVLRHLLALLVLRIGRIVERSLCPGPDTRRAFAVYQAFAALLEQHYADRHDVQFYADALHLAPVKLGRQLDLIAGRTTKQIIDERIVLEARRRLLYSDATLGAIAQELGYSDQFHLSKTFKRVTGHSPQEYRTEHQKVT